VETIKRQAGTVLVHGCLAVRL